MARKFLTPKESKYLCENYPHKATEVIAQKLDCKLHSVYGFAKRLGLKKAPEFLASSSSGRLASGDNQGRSTRFQKGHAPANKGLRRPGYAPGRMQESQFRKGRPASESRNYLPIGSEKLDSKRGVIVRKITDDQSIVPAQRWRPVHTLVWEAANGKVPAGHIVIFKPGMKTLDSTQISLDRVELVTLAENMRRNTLHNYPKELADTYRLIGAVTRQINKRTKDEK